MTELLSMHRPRLAHCRGSANAPKLASRTGRGQARRGRERAPGSPDQAALPKPASRSPCEVRTYVLGWRHGPKHRAAFTPRASSWGRQQPAPCAGGGTSTNGVRRFRPTRQSTRIRARGVSARSTTARPMSASPATCCSPPAGTRTRRPMRRRGSGSPPTASTATSGSSCSTAVRRGWSRSTTTAPTSASRDRTDARSHSSGSLTSSLAARPARWRAACRGCCSTPRRAGGMVRLTYRGQPLPVGRDGSWLPHRRGEVSVCRRAFELQV